MRAIYSEDGGSFLVDVLSDETEGDMRRVTIRCIETIEPSAIFGDIPVGAKWEISSRVGFEAYVGWSLEPVAPGT